MRRDDPATWLDPARHADWATMAPEGYERGPGLLTQGGQGGRRPPWVASRFHRTPINLPLNLHRRDLMELTYLWPPWLSGFHHPRRGLHNRAGARWTAHALGHDSPQTLQSFQRHPVSFRRDSL